MAIRDHGGFSNAWTCVIQWLLIQSTSSRNPSERVIHCELLPRSQDRTTVGVHRTRSSDVQDHGMGQMDSKAGMTVQVCRQSMARLLGFGCPTIVALARFEPVPPNQLRRQQNRRMAGSIPPRCGAGAASVDPYKKKKKWKNRRRRPCGDRRSQQPRCLHHCHRQSGS